VVAVVVVAVVALTPSGHRPAKITLVTKPKHPASAHLPPAAEAGLLPWHLAAPISRVVVLPGTGSQVVILGGLTTGNTSSGAVFTLDTTTGTLTQVGDLPAPIHDAAAAVMAGQDLVFGGGSPNTVGAVQAFPAPAATGPAGSGAATGTTVAQLPAPRSDAAEVTMGTTAYLVGGYDGTIADGAVLATTNGRTFRTVASLPVAVRYPAVAALSGKIFVFGGQAITGPQAGQPTDSIQVIDPARHVASVVGRLPETLSGAAAVTLGGHIYVVGGESTAPQTSTPGVGTTQIASAPSGSNPGAGKAGAITDAYTTRGPTGPAPVMGPSGASTAVLTDTASPTPSTASAGRAQTVASGPTTTSGSTQTATVSTIWAFNPTTATMLPAGRLQVPVSHMGVAVIGSTAWLVGGESSGTQVAAVQMVTPNAMFGTAGASGAGSPYFGYKLLVADRGNNRLLLMDAAMHVVWTYPSASSPADPLGFYFPDDAFFVNKGSAIISNQEQNETIVQIGYPSGKILWSYGHPKQAGTSQGYLHEPDDAYLLKNGQISVADAQNCRVLVLNANGSVADQIGTTGVCVHNPPVSMGSPNGDTPLADGNLLVSEINGSWVSEYTPQGSLVWTVHLPISYPSDPQQLGPDLYLIADYASPGEVLEFNRQGQISYRYDPASGPGMLNHPSLSEMLPSGAIMANDDYRNRMMAFDPTTGALVWQYGISDQAGTAPGMLNTPDGFDLLSADGSTPTHPATG